MTPTICNRLTYLILFYLFCFTAIASAASPSKNEQAIPNDLAQWSQWVKKGYEQLDCPAINYRDFNHIQNHLCAWSSPLKISVQQKSSQFTVAWHIIVKSKIALPGNTKYWPQQVRVNNKAYAVLNFNGVPTIELAPGDYKIQGQLNWQVQPENITIPSIYALVEVDINGKPIAFPRLTQQALWLQSTDKTQQRHNSVDLSVVRKITDGEYIQLNTQITVDVAGKMREEALGTVLPQGFQLIGIKSELNTYLDENGILNAKLKPGRWQINMYAYALPTQLTWQKPTSDHHWPAQEIWVFSADESIRSGKLSGAGLVDSKQANMPNNWYTLPSYLLEKNEQLTFNVQHRGKPLSLENKLQLERELWLDFSGDNFTFVDQITGNMNKDWRLSMQSPYLLKAAKDDDGALLITSQTPQEQGIENRYADVDIQAVGHINLQQDLPVAGWNQNFEKVSIKLNLPPGNQLFAVMGADTSSKSWINKWTIWTSFIVLLSALVATRLINIFAGITTGLMMLLIYQIEGSPIFVILNLLLALAIKKHQPFTALNNVVKTYWFGSAAIAVGAILLFSAQQVRTAIYPQLDVKQTHYAQANERRARREQHLISAHKREKQQVTSAINAEDIAQVPDSKLAESLQRVTGVSINSSNDKEYITVSGVRSNIKNEPRYQNDALLQAGSGIPNWQWNSYYINWRSDVTKEQSFRLIILSITQYRLLKIVATLITLFWLFIMLKSVLTTLSKSFVLPQSIAKLLPSLLIIGLLPTYSPDSMASSYPDQAMLEQLKNRVLEAPTCAPHCANINNLAINFDTNKLVLNFKVHAQHDTAIALPKSEFWRPESVTLNKHAIKGLYKHQQWVYVPINKGIHTLTVIGRYAAVDTFQLQFKEKPAAVYFNEQPQWVVAGLHNNTLNSHSITFIANAITSTIAENAEGENNKASSRYPIVPFVKVTRSLVIGHVWRVDTVVERIAPFKGSINLAVDLLPNEKITSADINQMGNKINITIPDGADEFYWSATLDRASLLNLTASTQPHFIEEWIISTSPVWHSEFSDLPSVLDDSAYGYYEHIFYPYPGETLTIKNTRPAAVKGNVLAIDKVDYKIEQSERTSVVNLSFNYRSTRGGTHEIVLPLSYQLTQVKSDNQLLNLQTNQQKLTLPIAPGEHDISIQMRSDQTSTMLFSMPKVNLNAPTSNINQQVNLNNRWVLFAQGPLLGPAVLYWGELLIFILLAVLISKVKFSPLSTVSWVIFGFGLSLNNWSVLIFIAVWFATLTASTYRPNNLSRTYFNLSQLFLYGLSLIAIITLISVVPMSLLSSPDMGIAGNHSSSYHLKWFADKTQGVLPNITIVSIPQIVYKGMMLVWVIWLSFAFLNWVKWAWKILGEQGYWRAKEINEQASSNVKTGDHANQPNTQTTASDQDANPENKGNKGNK
ncbi:hypothetical protein [Algibacillus agarilyticus]|uniref:hypothetical protein n=1 Tax=Algibacillus agarilyticus TaxID=2234133 RepID=UPI000DD07180|nr:hypothetical protein [Algibacillus agarilyticus]